VQAIAMLFVAGIWYSAAPIELNISSDNSGSGNRTSWETSGL